ncbi:DUF4129 domain-containing protein [Pseudarthrobacter polychromogenes]|uniref:Protein-glutamine gamma-glutamyltransferase-like C-terminal domain-containing protein n=1 Tax=Pseudarthrobacter polychromogenes TaxID=1676 RepID=A0ABQ1XSF4_9MICC|nr:DUF4129 domain-containing protein [Pseudarthrobacter polychromogenes]GGH01671.1 hypothetical protein GCM10011577_26830 [Pseudarthrobacter polychromogenes]
MAAEPPVLPGAEEARRWAAEELSQPEYRDAAPGWVETLWENFLDWLSTLDGSADAGSTVPSPVIGLVIAVIIAAAVIIAKPRLNPKARQVKEVFEPEGELAAGDYRQRAETSAAAGRWGDAVVDRFRALVRSAEDRTILDPQPGRTADEVARDLALPFSTAGQRLDRAAGMFDAIRYGNRTADAGDYRAMAGLDDALEALKPVRRPGNRDEGHQDYEAPRPAVLP